MRCSGYDCCCSRLSDRWQYQLQKIKKNVSEDFTLELTKNPDILDLLGKIKRSTSSHVIGFAAESEELLSNTKQKLQRKNLRCDRW